MDIRVVEQKQTELLQILILVVTLCLGGITYLAVSQGMGNGILSLTILALLACLYVIPKERQLKQTHNQLVQSLVDRERKIKTGQQQLLEEQKKTAVLDMRFHELTSLYSAIVAVDSEVDYKKAFDAVLGAALDLTEGGRGAIMLVDEDKRRLVTVCTHGFEDGFERECEELDHGPAGWVAKIGDPLLWNDNAKQDRRYKELLAGRNDPDFCMFVPLTLRDRVLGVISLSEASTSFTEAQLRLTHIFAQHAVVAIENAQLLKTVIENGLAEQAQRSWSRLQG